MQKSSKNEKNSIYCWYFHRLLYEVQNYKNNCKNHVKFSDSTHCLLRIDIDIKIAVACKWHLLNVFYRIQQETFYLCSVLFPIKFQPDFFVVPVVYATNQRITGPQNQYRFILFQDCGEFVSSPVNCFVCFVFNHNFYQFEKRWIMKQFTFCKLTFYQFVIITISDNFKKTLKIIFDEYLGKWNYRAQPLKRNWVYVI